MNDSPLIYSVGLVVIRAGITGNCISVNNTLHPDKKFQFLNVVFPIVKKIQDLFTEIALLFPISPARRYAGLYFNLY